MGRRCVFCDIEAGRAPASVVVDDDSLIAFMDIYPMRAGHVLVAPRQHAVRIDELADGEVERLFAIGARIGRAIRASEIPCDDIHFVLNDGPAASQTIPHAHLHIVPRVRGDLARMARKLLQRPLQPLLGAAPRADLDAVAAAIRAHL